MPTPAFYPSNRDHIPEYMRSRPQWLVWEWRERGTDRECKVPVRVDADGKRYAVSRNDTTAWLSFESAVAVVEGAGDPNLGIEYALVPDDRLIAIDIDDCVSSSGKVFAEARELVNLAGSYAEISPSGRGIRILGFGEIAEGARKHGETDGGLRIERFDAGHAPTITGNVVQGLPLGELDVLTEVLEAGPFKKAEPRDRSALHGDDLEFDAAVIRESLCLLSPLRADSYHDWLKVGSALATIGPEMAGVFHTFSSQSDKYDEATAERKFADLLKGCSWTIGDAVAAMLGMAAEDSGSTAAAIVAEARGRLGRDRHGFARKLARLKIGSRGRTSWEGIDSGTLPDPSPLLFRPYPADALPGVLGDVVRYGARAMELDPSVVALPCLVAAAACVGTTRRLALKNAWRPFPILWGALVAESGEGKSPAFDLAGVALKARQAEIRGEHAAATADHEAELEEWRQAKAQAKKGSAPPKPQPPEPPAVVWTSDTTNEAACRFLARSPRGIAVLADELAGFLGGLNRYNAGSGDEGLWLSCHDGRPHSVGRASSEGSEISCAAAWIVGNLPPGVAHRAFGEDKRQSGLVPRFLLCMPPARRIGDDRADLPLVVMQRWEGLCSHLLRLRGTDDDKPVLLSLSAAGRDRFLEWRKAHRRRYRALRGDVRSAMSKLAEAPLRLAQVFHEIEAYCSAEWQPSPSREIGLETLERALAVADWHAHEALRVYARLEAAPDEFARSTAVDMASAAVLDELSEAGRALTLRELATACRDLGDDEIVGQAVADLLARGEVLQAAGEPPAYSAVEAAPLPEIADEATGGPEPLPEGDGAGEGNPDAQPTLFGIDEEVDEEAGEDEAALGAIDL